MGHALNPFWISSFSANIFLFGEGHLLDASLQHVMAEKDSMLKSLRKR